MIIAAIEEMEREKFDANAEASRSSEYLEADGRGDAEASEETCRAFRRELSIINPNRPVRERWVPAHLKDYVISQLF